MSFGEKYVGAAYTIALAAVLACIVIIALRLGRFEGELAELEAHATPRPSGEAVRQAEAEDAGSETAPPAT